MGYRASLCGLHWGDSGARRLGNISDTNEYSLPLTYDITGAGSGSTALIIIYRLKGEQRSRSQSLY